MKRSIILLAILALVPVGISCKRSIGAAYVISNSGLYMRAGQSVASAKLLLIPAGSKVTLLEKGSNAAVDAISASWYRAEFDGRQGWVFGGYLLKEHTCPCRNTPGMVGSIHYGPCTFPGGIEDQGGGKLPESENVYVGRYKSGDATILLTEIAVGYMDRYACFFTADKLVVREDEKTKIFYGMECSAKKLKNTGIIALAEVGENYEVVIKKAWGVDAVTGKIREIDPAEATCELPCKGAECI